MASDTVIKSHIYFLSGLPVTVRNNQLWFRKTCIWRCWLNHCGGTEIKDRIPALYNHIVQWKQNTKNTNGSPFTGICSVQCHFHKTAENPPVRFFLIMEGELKKWWNLFGYIFTSFLCLYLYCKIMNRLNSCKTRVSDVTI